MKLRVWGVAMAMATNVAVASAADIKPAVILDLGGHKDPFDEMVNQAALQFQKDTGVAFDLKIIGKESDREAFMEDYAAKGYDPIVAVAFSQAAAMAKAAKQHPQSRFVILDGKVDLPNVQSYVFREEEGAFIVGIAAAMKSGSGTIGFVGGMDIPPIHRFACGYAQGAKYANPNIKILSNMTGTTIAAFGDPAKGAKIAKSEIDQGADVIFAAAGLTGTGVYQAAADAGKFAIGVDANQNGLQPGHMLTSMVKRMDVAAITSLKEARDGTWKGGVRSLGLAEGGVDWALDDENAALVSDATKAKVEQAKKDIVAGTLKVHDYVTDNACPM